MLIVSLLRTTHLYPELSPTFLVDCNYLKFLETLAIWEEKKIPCGFPISLPVWTGAEKTESNSTYLLN